jgi:pSer/pThr/pTyr-binding forkhead associated (FHA) protein
MTQFALRFLSGVNHGVEIPIPMNGELIIGRLSAADIMIVDNDVSRRHARVFFENGLPAIEDLGSRNGTFVNSQRVTKTALQHSDQIFVGRCILKLVTLGTSSEALPVAARVPVSPSIQPLTPTTRPANPPTVDSFRGALTEIQLPDLLQLLSTARKSGVLVLRSGEEVGRIYIRDGHIYFASLGENINSEPHKILYRLLRWTSGSFELEKPSTQVFDQQINESTEAVLLEGMHELDELKNLAAVLPPLDARIALARPLPGRLAEMEKGDLVLLQLAHEHGTVRGILDHYDGTDFEGYTYLLGLIGRKFLIVAAS